MPKEEMDKTIHSVAETLRIGHLLERKTANLSGGEMQRVSIGRAIVRSPRVFLMDEPLSNLDAKLRESLRVELQHMQKDFGITTLFVTHDQIEALTMADRIAVLNHGQVIQVGSPRDIYDKPADTYVAQLVGTPRINLFEASREDGRIFVKNSELHLSTPEGIDLPPAFQVGIRPEDIQLDQQGGFHGQIVLTEPLGVETILHIQSGEQVLLSTVPGMTPVGIHDQVRFNLLEDRMHCFDLDGNRIG
jgi:multiple sugar transport system ATP-binding protein